LHLDANERVEALEYFKKVQQFQKDFLVKALKQKGQVFEQDGQELPLTKLMEPSIFDDDTTKGLKSTLNDVQEYIKECADMEQIQPQLD
tara:strand:+ start:178 stop:444 length:267 start_codon:yes stop_codon:yes gene_type:complete